MAVFENLFEKEFKTKFSNVVVFRDKGQSLLDRLDGAVVEAVDKLGSSGNLPITEAKVKRVLSKAALRGLGKFGGLRASIRRLEGSGILVRDEKFGWTID